MINAYTRPMGWLICDLRRPVLENDILGVLWEMLPYGGSLTAANDD